MIKELFWTPIVLFVNLVQPLFLHHKGAYKILLINWLEGFRWHISLYRAARLAKRAAYRVPAYNNFYGVQGNGGFGARHFTKLPITDKENFVKKYHIEDRAWDGKLPSRGLTVDESSGSTGQPTNWVRGWGERMNTKELLQLSFYSTFGKGEIFAFNAFVLGAWATGMIVSQSLGEIVIMKSTGSDAQKILDTMKYFGKGYHYVIMGYPPFLKSLVDDNDFDWTGYNVDAVYGGEAITEQLRDYLSQTFGKVVGSYGASDLEVNIGYENDLTIAIRKALHDDPNVRRELAKDFGSLPSVFQYNPLAYYVETNEHNELIFTINRATNVTPKIRYNIHDVGYKMRYKEVVAALERAGRTDIISTLKKDGKRVLNLPFLFHYGRSDMSITYFGAKVTPEGIRQALNMLPNLSPCIESFQGFNAENKQKDTLMVICVELIKGKSAKEFPAKAIADAFCEELGKLNGDFYKMLLTAKTHLRPEVRIFEYQTGPFADGHRKIKHSYVATAIQYDSIPG